MHYSQNYKAVEELLLSPTREVHSKIEILDWQERTIGEIQGRVIDGTLNVEGNSAIRRTCSLTIVIDETNYDISSLTNQIGLHRKVKIFQGVAGPEGVIWFPLGVFVLTEGSISHSVTDNSLSLTAKDKMCLLSGEVGGELQSPVELHRESFFNKKTGRIESRELLIYDIIKYAVIGLGGENPAKVIINDVPLEIKDPLEYIGNTTKYFDAHGNEVAEGDPSIVRVLNPGDLAGYRVIPFTFPTELIKNAGETVLSILEDIVAVLGNYEFFYDVNGNFIFQEIKNYKNTMFTPLTKLPNGSYISDFSKVPRIYSFKEKNIVESYSNTPDWKNIKNDFVVWGTRQDVQGDAHPLQFHLVIDDRPNLPPGYNKPWQQFLVEYGDQNPQDPGLYYQELKSKLPQIYDAETNKWRDEPHKFNYFFDMIDSKSELGKFSVSSIGRRTKVVVDEKVSRMYPPEIPDRIILEAGVPQETIDHLNRQGLRFLIVSDMSLYRPGKVGKDAFTVIRELLYLHTTFNEVITLTCLPLYFLEVNHRIEVEDTRSNIFGDYLITSMSIPLGTEGLMAITAIRVSSRI